MARDKKLIDRELMYQKIMPTFTKPKDSDTAQSSPVHTNTTLTTTPQEQTSTDIFTKPIEPKDVKKTVLINILETIVVNKVDSAMDRFNCCHCDKCKKDIIALTLNKLPPKYMVFEEKRMAEMVAKQATADVTAALVQSILKVKSSPRH